MSGIVEARKRYRNGLTAMSVGGEKYMLSNGCLHTSGSLAKVAASRGLPISQPTMSKRLKAGERDFDRLMQLPNADHSNNGAAGAAKKRAKKEADLEFMAALAAVNARRRR